MSADLKHEVKAILDRHQGRDHAIKRRELRDVLNLPEKEDRKLRLIIGELRQEGTPILFATSFPEGYYLPNSYEELREGIEKLRSYVIEECMVLRGFRVYGNRYLLPAEQKRLL